MAAAASTTAAAGSRPGGLLLFSAFTLYDLQKLIHAAKSKPAWDPINESLGIYLDAI
jgi:FtsH-binding integral membrane protein